MLLKDQTAVITGGAQGLELAMVRTFAAHGARVGIGDLAGEGARAGAAWVGSPDRRLGGAYDVTDAGAGQCILGTAVAHFGPLGVVVNSAGSNREAIMRTMTEDQFDQVIAVHLR